MIWLPLLREGSVRSPREARRDARDINSCVPAHRVPDHDDEDGKDDDEAAQRGRDHASIRDRILQGFVVEAHNGDHRPPRLAG